MSVMKQQIIFIVFAMGIIGLSYYYIWHRRKRIACSGPSSSFSGFDSVTSSIEPCVDVMAGKKKDYIEDDKDEDLSLHESSLETDQNEIDNECTVPSENRKLTNFANVNSQKLVPKKSASQPRRSLAVYVPPPARTSSTKHVSSSKQPHPPSLNAHPKNMSFSSSSTPVKKSSKQSRPPMLPATTDYIVTIKIPLWLVSRFIGKQGCGIKSLKQLSGAEFRVLRHPATNCSHTLCNIIGSARQIEVALESVSKRFPEVTLPHNPSMRLFRHNNTQRQIPKKCQDAEYVEIPPAIIPSSPFLASISHIDSLSSIWIHVADMSGSSPWQELYEKINSTYTFASSMCNECHEESQIIVGHFYAVRIDEGNFARGIVEEVVLTDIGEKTYLVMLIDNGKHITNVTTDRLIPLR